MLSVNSTKDIIPLEQVEREAILNAIRVCKENVIKASVYLEVAPSTLYRKLKKWGVSQFLITGAIIL